MIHSKKQICMFQKEIQVTMNYKNKINKYTKLDPTLPELLQLIV